MVLERKQKKTFANSAIRLFVQAIRNNCNKSRVTAATNHICEHFLLSVYSEVDRWISNTTSAAVGGLVLEQSATLYFDLNQRRKKREREKETMLEDGMATMTIEEEKQVSQERKSANE